MRREWDYIPLGGGEGRYARAATTGPELLASRLALAAANGIPFHEALLSLTVYGVPLKGSAWLSFFKYRNWDFCLRAAAFDLCNGLPLSDALQRLRYFLPDFYLAGVVEAERNGSLEKTLPAFADSMQFSGGIRGRYWGNASYPLVEMFFILMLICSLGTFILPKFARIMVELLEGYHYPMMWFRSFGGIGVGIMTCCLLLIFLYFLLRRFHWEVMTLLEVFLWVVPFCRKQLRSIGMMELAASMRACLDSGMDVVAAVDFSRKSSRHLWLRRRLARCGKKLAAGMPLTKAWQEVAAGDPMSEFFVDSATGSENLSAAFAAMGDWNSENSVRLARINSVMLMLSLLAVNVIIVFSLEYAVFRSLILIIEKLSMQIW